MLQASTPNQLKHKQAIAKLNNNSVVIYYSLHGKEMRFPTGVSLKVEKGKIWNPIDWDRKTGRLRLASTKLNDKDLVSTLKVRQGTIDALLKKANDIIDDYFQKDITIKPDELQLLLADQQQGKVKKANTPFFEYVQAFVDRKAAHFKHNGNPISIKDYVSAQGLLKDYESFKKKPNKVVDINLHWLQEFVNYMKEPHPEYYGEHRVTSDGNMKNGTIKKRLDFMAEFFGYLKELKVVSNYEVDVIKNYKRTIKKEATVKETLDIDEIHALYKQNFINPAYRTISDLFVFLCLTGIRYQDLVDFDVSFIQDSKDGTGKVYVKKASKTGIDYNIPLCKIVLDILKKYKNKLPIMASAYGNRLIKEALEITGRFNNLTQVKDKETGKYKRRCDLITLHKGRNSFITNLVDTVPLNELMKYTGHKKLSTLQGYIDTTRAVKMEYIQVFDLKTA